MGKHLISKQITHFHVSVKGSLHLKKTKQLMMTKLFWSLLQSCSYFLDGWYYENVCSTLPAGVADVDRQSL